jgi:hypothetical protein
MCNLGRVQVPLMQCSETPMSDKVQDNAEEAAVDELREKTFELSGTISRDVTTKVTQAAVKRPVSDLLGVDVDANSSVIASCIRDVCLESVWFQPSPACPYRRSIVRLANVAFPAPYELRLGLGRGDCQRSWPG